MKSLSTAGCVAEVASRIESLTALDEARWGVMRVGEMVRHVDGAFRIALGEESAARAESPLPRGLMKWVALRSPVRWPKDVPTVPELRRETERVRGGEFAVDRGALLEALGRFASVRELRTEHPILGAMETGDWMRWGWLHTDHHLRQFGR